MPVEYGQQTRAVATAVVPSSVSQCQIMHMMHRCNRNNRSTFLLHQIDSESTRPITPHCASLIKSSQATLSCVLRAYLWRLSVIYMLYLHVYEACRSSLSPLPTILLSSPRFLATIMSHTHPTSTSPNVPLIFDNALKAYKKRTKNDLLTHPLADRFEACNSASSILTVLREQVQELNKSQRNNTKWLDPTVNVLHAFSETLRDGVGSVCFRTQICPRSTVSYLFDRYSHLQR